MRALIQRVSRAAVTVDDRPVGAIDGGLLVFIGVRDGDGPDEATYLSGKVANLRIFEDDAGKMNRSALDLGLAVLVVSQFTLYGDTSKGRRPSFVHAAQPDVARPLVDRVADALRALGMSVSMGEFGAHMEVSLVNDGPVTIWLDTDTLR
ncbi:MAG TPA: D-aminoacyl-tRNA deacylase [Thermomicrobiaceae bacterium]|nr:D-aminoacyl-tRNA deacylase [Thermomicrobiaceae bacterium]